MNDFIIISVLNIFEFEWKIYVIILNDKIKNNDKFFEFDELFKNIEQKKIRMKITNVNFIKHDDENRDRNNIRDKNKNKNRDETKRESNEKKTISKKLNVNIATSNIFTIWNIVFIKILFAIIVIEKIIKKSIAFMKKKKIWEI